MFLFTLDILSAEATLVAASPVSFATRLAVRLGIAHGCWFAGHGAPIAAALNK